MKIKSQVEEVIKKRWHALKDPKELMSLYMIEKQTNQGYNGRQLLELFQNCEDEGATIVEIMLDTDKCLLKISNNGDHPFSLKGYDSIFYPGLSAKVSSGYIGNKGLGFRSIINWADEIAIISNDFKVVFNRSYKRDILVDEIGYTDEELATIRKDRKLNQDIYPIPLLNCCKISDLDEIHSYTTTIEIKYHKNFEQQIINQLKSISLKTLLFLRNISTINIRGNVLEDTIAVERSIQVGDVSKVTFNNETYYILSDDGIVDENLIDDNESSEPKRYTVKIAYNDDLTFRDSVLYNYFKTQIPFKLPFVAHASLELDQNRNHSTESIVNPFILNKLFELHLKLIDVLKLKKGNSWLPYYAINKEGLDIYPPYTQIIESKWKALDIFPTFSGTYLNQSSAKTLGDSFACFIEKNNLGEKCDKQIIPCELALNPEKHISKPADFVSIIESLAESLDFKNRAALIKLILTYYPSDKFSVLLDEEENKIGIKDFVYTDKTADNKDLKVPGYSKIRFLHPNLFQSLIKELDLDAETNKARALKDKLEKISDVHSFEPLTVIRKIIRETNDVLSSATLSKAEVIKEFYDTLFHNYFLKDNMAKLDFDGKIPCLNQMGDIKDIKELALSDEFTAGALSNQILKGIYDKERLLGKLTAFNLEGKETKQLEDFFEWLGINFISIIQLKSSNIDWQYTQYANRRYNIQISNYELYSIVNFDKLLQNATKNINHILAWLSLDHRVRAIFKNFTSTSSNTEKLQYSHYGLKSVSSFHNYIYYKIYTECQIDNYLITNKREEWFNPFKIDYDYLKNINPHLDKHEVDRILLFFGAKKDFNDLNIHYLSKKNMELAERKNPKGSQVFYKSLVGHYKQNAQKINGADFYAKQGDEIIVKNASEIYFSDRIQLPESLTNKFPILYYPSRSGGAMAVEMFGLNNLNSLDLEIIEAKPLTSVALQFEKFIKEIKPFILAFRLDKITKEDVKRNQVQRLNKLKIECFSEVTCSISGDAFIIEPYNYVFGNDQFYISIPAYETLESLRHNKHFIDNLSDIFLKVFDTLDEKKIFESILRQSWEDNLYDVNNELAEGILEESRILLGEISIRLSIWKTIFKLKSIEICDQLSENNLDAYISDFFPELYGYELFGSDDNLNDIRNIREVFKVLNVRLDNYNGISDYKLSFDKLFNTELANYYSSIVKSLKNQLWRFLLENGNEEEHGSFLSYLFRIDNLASKLNLNQNATSYDFNNIILSELSLVFPNIKWTLEKLDFQSYDQVEKENAMVFSQEELMKLRRNQKLNGLSYFIGYNDKIKTELLKLEEREKQESNSTIVILDSHQEAEFIDSFEIEVSTERNRDKPSSGLWLGGTSDDNSNSHNKILGTKVEEIVYEYLTKNTDLYDDVDYIAKTNEGAHYDIKYFDINANCIKYAECKYYNGFSFLWSTDEKLFADDHIGQYEIWLVNKDRKIFLINNIKQLGKLQPMNYKVNIKLKEHAITN